MRTFISLLLICFVRIAFAGSPVPIVIYPGDEFRFAEYLETLRTALDKTIASHGPYVLKPASVSMNEDRYLAEARSGKLVNVVWSAATRDNERNLLPVRIPLGKGILGYRIALIHKDNQHMLGQIKSLDDLRNIASALAGGGATSPFTKKPAFRLSQQTTKACSRCLPVSDSIFSHVASTRYFWSTMNLTQNCLPSQLSRTCYCIIHTHSTFLSAQASHCLPPGSKRGCGLCSRMGHLIEYLKNTTGMRLSLPGCRERCPWRYWPRTRAAL